MEGRLERVESQVASKLDHGLDLVKTLNQRQQAQGEDIRQLGEAVAEQGRKDG